MLVVKVLVGGIRVGKRNSGVQCSVCISDKLSQVVSNPAREPSLVLWMSMSNVLTFLGSRAEFWLDKGENIRLRLIETYGDDIRTT